MFRTVELQKIINLSDADGLKRQIDNFSSLNNDVEYFIRHKAVDYEKRAFCRTFLVVDENIHIVGFFTLGLKNLAFQDYVSNSKKKSIHGISSDVSSVPVILIGQLSKNLACDNAISGEELLDFAIDMVYNAQDIVGGRICLVETATDEENQKVIEFYENCGFVKLQKDENGEYQQLYKKIK